MHCNMASIGVFCEFITKGNGVKHKNWPPYRDWKAEVSSVSPSSERIRANFRVSLPHRRRTTVSIETNPLYSFGVKHTLIAPYHPRSNGLVELFRSVQTLKQFYKAGDATQLSVARFFFNYWTKQNSRADQTPAEFFLNRGLNSRLDLLVERVLTSKVIRKREWIKAAKNESS
mgnify:CR=1 FL=1